jgi:hypothetical protein
VGLLQWAIGTCSFALGSHAVMPNALLLAAAASAFFLYTYSTKQKYTCMKRPILSSKILLLLFLLFWHKWKTPLQRANSTLLFYIYIYIVV